MNYLDSPVQLLSDCLADVIYEDRLPQIDYLNRNWDEWKKLSSQERANIDELTYENRPDLWINCQRKPRKSDVKIIAFFPQVWGSTALGFGGIGGAAMTTAYTVVIQFETYYAVYFGGRFAYVIESPNNYFIEDMKSFTLSSVRDSEKYKDVKNG